MLLRFYGECPRSGLSVWILEDPYRLLNHKKVLSDSCHTINLTELREQIFVSHQEGYRVFEDHRMDVELFLL